MADGGAGAGRCLSDLSDDLLRHILFLAPDREGASTAVLSRRWRWLWRTSGAVYLDSRSFSGGADKALAAAHGPIRRLTFFIAEDNRIDLLIAAMVSNPAARRVEEIQIKSVDSRCRLSLGSLPSEAVRVLRITNCSILTAVMPSGAAVFPMLVDLHLQDCSVRLVDLQSIIDAAPWLSTLHLAASHFSTAVHGCPVGRLLIPAVSVLVLEDCRYSQFRFMPSCLLELDVPRLRYFRYKGHIEDTNRLSLNTQGSANMVHVDLHLTHDDRAYAFIKGPTPTTNELLWRYIHNFNTTKVLKLRIDYFTMDDLAVVDKASRYEVLSALSFSFLEQLELEVECNSGFETSMVMLADLLRCCPMVRDLRIKLTKKYEMPWSQSSTDKEDGVHYDKSVSGFRDRRRTSSLAAQNDDNYEAFGIPGLTGEHSFSCLESHLKRVSLQFFMDEPNCLGVRLAKFFAKNATVLQEMHIDDGSQEMVDHVNSSVPRWIANTSNDNYQLNLKD